MGFPCERVRHKIEQHREHNHNTQWPCDQHIDDRCQQKITKTPYSTSHETPAQLNVRSLCNRNEPNNDCIDRQQQHYQQHYRQLKPRNEAQSNRQKTTASMVDDDVDGNDDVDGGNDVDCRTSTVNNNRLHHHRPQKAAIGNGFIKRITQLISFNPGHRRETTLSPILLPTTTRTTIPTITEPCVPSDDASATLATAATNDAGTPVPTTNTTNGHCQRRRAVPTNVATMPTTTASGHTATTTTTTTVTSSTSQSQYFVRQSLCLYAASSFLLVLCYFATAVTAAEAAHPM